MQEASFFLNPNGCMPVKALFESQDQSFPIFSATFTEAIGRSYSLDIICRVPTPSHPEDFLHKTWTVNIEDARGEQRQWMAECLTFSEQKIDTEVWEFTCHLESILSRLKNESVALRGDVSVDLKTWVRGMLAKHGISHAAHWHKDSKICRSRLLQVHQNDYDCLLSVLSQENIMLVLSPDDQMLHFMDSPEQCTYGSVKRLFVKDKAELLQSGGMHIGAFDHEEVHRFAISPDEYWDATQQWENQHPIRLYSGVPCISVPGTRAGSPLKPCNRFHYDMPSIEKLCDSHHFSLKEQGEGYCFITTKSNAIAMKAGDFVNVVDVAKNNETQCRIQFVKHHLQAFGKSLRYHNELILQPAISTWRAVSPPKPIIPLVMQAHIHSTSASPMLDENGNESIQIPSNIHNEMTILSVPRARPYVSDQGGFHFPLEDQVEVLISFLYGEPNLPVIVGMLQNDVMKGPVPHHDLKQFVIATGNGNVLRMDDDPAAPHVTLQTSPMHGLLLKNDEGISVQSEGAIRVTSASNITLKADGSCNIQAKENAALSTDASFSMTSTEGDIQCSAKKSIDTVIQNNMTVEVGKNLEVNNQSLNISVGNQCSFTVENGSARYHAADQFRLNAAKEITLSSDERIVISSPSGEPWCVIDRDKIVLQTNNQCLFHADHVVMKGF